MLSTQDIDRILNRLDKIEEGQKELLKSIAKTDQLIAKMDQINQNHDSESPIWKTAFGGLSDCGLPGPLASFFI